jgi:hypothetical protein
LLTIEVVAIPKGVKVTHKGPMRDRSSSQVLFDFSNALTRMPFLYQSIKSDLTLCWFFFPFDTQRVVVACALGTTEKKKQCEALPKMGAIFLLK